MADASSFTATLAGIRYSPCRLSSCPTVAPVTASVPPLILPNTEPDVSSTPVVSA